MPILATGPVPRWELDWPGRLKCELDGLERAGATWSVDQGRLSAGSLSLDLGWPTATGVVRLRVDYPDTFPWTRPLVFLVDAPAGGAIRHYSPVDRQICLLGRDSRQWNAQWTVAKLLARQLADALAGTDDEDPQGEPAEFWWNTLIGPSTPGFCLVDSAWSPPRGIGGGQLRVRYAVERLRTAPCLRGCVEEVVADGGAFRVGMASPVPNLPETMSVPWVHLDETLHPCPREEVAAKITALIAAHPRMATARARKLDGHNHHGKLLAFSYPIETAHRQAGTGWLFVLIVGRDPVRPGQRIAYTLVRTLRAGDGDLAVRNPEARRLAGKKIAVLGVGAIGAPVASELAGNGCGDLVLVDCDIVEPGNSIRWIAGQPAWGHAKVEAAKSLIERQWPSCRVATHHHYFGGPNGDQALFEEALHDCDLVVDATASYGVTLWLGAVCRAAGIPLISAMATADVSGGAVGLFRPDGGCPRCLEHAWHQGDVPEFGKPGDELALQPPGCSERTFIGGGYDLREIGLQTVRAVLAGLDEGSGSIVASLRFGEGLGGLRAPSWHVDELRDYRECGCRRHAE